MKVVYWVWQLAISVWIYRYLKRERMWGCLSWRHRVSGGSLGLYLCHYRHCQFHVPIPSSPSYLPFPPSPSILSPPSPLSLLSPSPLSLQLISWLMRVLTSVMEKQRKHKTGNSQSRQNLFLSYSLSDGLAQYCPNLFWCFHIKQQHLHQASPFPFRNLKYSQ